MSKIANLCLVACLFYVPGCADEKKPELASASPHDFLRRTDNEFQTAAKIYTSEKNPKLKIRLLAVIHIGEPQYYQHIQHLLDQSNTILYESMIVEWRHSPDLRCRQRAYLEPQAGVASLLGLVMQGDMLTYAASKSFNIDYPLATMKQWDASFDCEASLKAILSLIVKKRPDLSVDKLLALDEESFKKTLNPRDLFESDSISRKKMMEGMLLGPSALPAQYRKTMVDQRDEKALQGIENHLHDTGMTTVIYGAGHMPGLEAGLRRMGYFLESEEWLTVFHL